MNKFNNMHSEILSEYVSRSVVNLNGFKEIKHASTPVTFYWKDETSKEILNIDKSEEEDVKINNRVRERSKMFLDKLSQDIHPPSLGIEPNGALLFEWHTQSAKKDVGIFSVIIDEETVIYSTLNLEEVDSFGECGSRGIATLSDSTISLITSILTKFFKNENRWMPRQDRHTH